MQNNLRELPDLINLARELHLNERRTTLESIQVIGELELRKAWYELGTSVEELAKTIGLSINKYRKRLTAWRVMKFFPRARELFEKGEIDLSHLSMIAGRITEANEDILWNGIRGTTKREAEAFVSRIQKDGSIRDDDPLIEFTVRMKESERGLLDRAREVLAHGGHVPTHTEVFLTAIADLLEKRDPMKKAERALQRREKNSRSNVADKTISKVAKHPEPSLALEKVIFEDAGNLPVQGRVSNIPNNIRSTHESFESSSTTCIQIPGDNPCVTKPENLYAPSKVSIPGDYPPVTDSKNLPATSSNPIPRNNRTTPHPQKTTPRPQRKPIPAAIRHAVWQRDQGRCTYLHANGKACNETMMLELDHIQMVCRGGENAVANLRLRCRYHNQHEAEVKLSSAKNPPIPRFFRYSPLGKSQLRER